MFQIDPERPDYCSHERETQDSSRLENLCLTTYSGDTKVLVEFPRGSSYVNCGGRAWRSKEFLVDSGKLLRTGSAVFARLLSPEQQARTRRRLEVAPDDHEGFVLDMTPPPEGDELAARLAGLSLPPGVRDWWMAKRRLGVSRYLVSGHDDHCPRHLEVDVDCQETPGRAPPDHDEDNEMLDLEDVLSSQPRKIHDYCPIRHRVNIIRLLLAIQGEELILNSAPRVYTLVDIAKSLDCTGVIVSGEAPNEDASWSLAYTDLAYSVIVYLFGSVSTLYNYPSIPILYFSNIDFPSLGSSSPSGVKRLSRYALQPLPPSLPLFFPNNQLRIVS